MTIENLGGLGNLIAAIATIAALIFLAQQIRKNSKSVEGASAQATLDLEKTTFALMALEDIKSRSASDREIVVEYMDAMEILDIFDWNRTKVLGWEGWIKYPNGQLGHSQKHQGTTDLSNMPNKAAIALTKCTIMQANTEWEEKPEIENATLLFCITTNT